MLASSCLRLSERHTVLAMLQSNLNKGKVPLVNRYLLKLRLADLVVVC